MTKILSLEMKGFKSFANKTKLVFKDGLNVIVGPNGSGKSNIMDALCFVLGKTKKKEMRAKKLAHLIFNGGKGKKAMKFAKVVLTLENKGDFPLKTKQVRISRAVNRDGNSVFRINGKRSSLSEIINLLRQGNIDTEGFNIILQGEINKFVDLSSTQRREIIDDVSGVSVYEEKKKKALNELEKVEEKTKDKRIVLAEKEKYLKELLGDKENAEKYLEMKDKLRFNNARLIFKKKHDLEKEKQEKQSKIESLEKRKKKLEHKIGSNNQKYQEMEKEIEQIEQDLGEKGQKEERKLRDAIEKTAIELQKSENRVDNHKKEIQDIKQRMERIKSESKENQEEKKNIEKSLGRIKKELSDVEELINNKKKFTQEYSPFEIKKRIISLEKDTELLENQTQDMRKRENIIKSCKSSLKVINQRKQAVEQRKQKAENRMRELASKADEIEDYIRHLDKKRTNLEIKLRKFMSSLGRGTKALMQAENPGIIGNIMSLMQYPDNLSQAINALAGGRRNVIVVDNEDTAIWCINYLKRNKAGTATVLPMSRLKQYNLRKKEGEGVITRVIDAVKYNPKYEKVIQWLFRDSLIIKDLEVSKKIKGFRMATLDGDVVELSGVFRGGYKRKTMGPNKAEIDKKLEKVNSEMSRYKEYLDSLDKEIQEKRHEIELAEKKMREIEKGETEEKIKLDNAGTVDEKELIKKNMELNEKKEELKKLRKIEGDEEFKKVSKEISELQEKMNDLIVEQKTLNMRLETIEKEDTRLEKISKSLEKDKKHFEELLEKEEKNYSECKKSLKKMRKEQEKFFSKIKGLYEKRSEMKKKLDKLNKKINEQEKKKYKLERKKQKIQLEKAEISAKIQGLKEEYKEFEDIEIQRVYKSIKWLEKKIKSLEKNIEKFGPVNMKALETYNDVKKEYDKLLAKIEKLENEKQTIISKMEDIEEEKKETFMEAFEAIKKSLKRIYKNLSGGGDAKMILENEESPFEAGMELMVRPKGHRYVPLRALSGGEKTIVALAFIFAIQEYAPAPFYIFDEIDAALDKRNSQKLANTLKKSSEKSQIVIITHNDEVVASAEYLYGVSINKEGVSKVVSIELP